jgi:predicted ATPase
MASKRFHVITGASGAGKSTLLQALREQGFSVMPEAALAIVQEQAGRNGTRLPDTDLQAFMTQVVERNIRAYDAALSLPPPVFFDRGIPECLAHMRILGLEVNPAYLAQAQARRYAGTVFVAEPWPEIYVRDEWRRASFERAARSFEPTVAAYVEAGYAACALPKVPLAERVAFILDQLSV